MSGQVSGYQRGSRPPRGEKNLEFLVDVCSDVGEFATAEGPKGHVKVLRFNHGGNHSAQPRSAFAPTKREVNCRCRLVNGLPQQLPLLDRLQLKPVKARHDLPYNIRHTFDPMVRGGGPPYYSTHTAIRPLQDQDVLCHTIL